jgi:hypothetical protein
MAMPSCPPVSLRASAVEAALVNAQHAARKSWAACRQRIVRATTAAGAGASPRAVGGCMLVCWAGAGTGAVAAGTQWGAAAPRWLWCTAAMMGRRRKPAWARDPRAGQPRPRVTLSYLVVL